MPIKFTFWNIDKKDDSFVNDLANAVQDTDILLLVESEIGDAEIKKHLGLERVKMITEQSDYTPKLYSRLGKAIHHLKTPHIHNKRLCFFSLQTKEYGNITIGGLHLQSKLYKDTPNQSKIARDWSREIRLMETLKGHERTIIVGDFNMNPFEEGMIQEDGFNATLSAEIAKRGKKTISEGYDYYYFYNPMWSLMGDRVPLSNKQKVPGSYYYDEQDVDKIYWNLFDSVIVRPELIDIIDYSTLQIKEVLPKNEFIKRKKPFPDHYPLEFNLNCTTK